MFDQYLNSLPKLRPTLVAAGIPEDVAEIVEADLTKSGYFGQKSLAPFVMLLALWLGMFLLSVAMNMLEEAFGRWWAIVLIGAMGGLGAVGSTSLAARYSRWFRARTFAGIALNRSHAFFGRMNDKALRVSDGKVGYAYIRAVTSYVEYSALAFIFGAAMSVGFSLVLS